MTQRRAKKVKIALPEKLDATQLAGLFGKILAARGKPLVLDARPLKYVGAQGVQLLLSAAKTWKRDGLQLLVTNVSEEVVGILSVLGIETADLAIDGAIP